MAVSSWLALSGDDLISNAFRAIPNRAPKGHGYVYILEISGGMSKVGRSAKPAVRFQEIRHEAGRRFGAEVGRAMVSPLVCHPSTLEKHFHHLLKRHRVDGEYFAVDFDRVARIAEDLEIDRPERPPVMGLPLKKKFLSITPELHRQLRLAAIPRDLTLVEIVDEAIAFYLRHKGMDLKSPNSRVSAN